MRAINVNLKPFDWMNVSSLCSYARDFVPNVPRSTTVLVYKPSGGDEGSFTWAVDQLESKRKKNACFYVTASANWSCVSVIL